MRFNKGFTLIEMLVCLTIVSVGLLAILQSNIQADRQSQYLLQQTVAWQLDREAALAKHARADFASDYLKTIKADMHLMTNR